MSENSNGIRVVLGPVAKSLIPGVSENRQDALDAAITRLMHAPANATVNSCADIRDSGTASTDEERIAAVVEEVAAMRRAFVEMKEISLVEMRMTRLLVGTLVDQGNEDHAALLRFATNMIQRMYANSHLLGKEDQQDLQRCEDLFERLNRMELDRVAEPEKAAHKSEELIR